MRKTSPKNKIARREGIDMGFKTPGSKAHASLLKRINIKPGQHGSKRQRRKQSEVGKQLREKQKLRFLFGMSETQLKNYFKKAVQKKGNTSVLLSQFLEKRLDNIVFRLGLTPTRGSARQLVNHRHFKVNGKVVSTPSYLLEVGDVVEIAKDKTKKIPYIEAFIGNKDIIMPKWLKRKANKGELTSDPTEEEISKQIDLRSVVEFYSR
ncbi:MAG: 30S ribosomal protein S4 [Patescibacteria group bacterium]